MKRRLLLGFLFTVLSAVLMTGPFIQASTAGEVEDRVEILEARMDEAEASFSDLLEVSGYLDTEYIFTKDKPGSNDGFRVHHLSLMFGKKIDDNWSFFSELEFEDAPKFVGTTAEGKIFLEAVYIDHDCGNGNHVRLGRYITPAGIWNLDHYPPFVPTQDRPQHIRKIFPQYLDGVQAFGSRNLNNVLVDYSVYVGNGGGEDGHGDSNQGKAIGGRAKVKLLNAGDVEIGVSAYSGKDNGDADRSSTGFDVRFAHKNIKFQGEYGKAKIKPAAGGDYNSTGWYGQVIYDINKVSLVYRYDTYEANSTTVSTKNVNTAAINYHFTPKVVGKFENHFISPEGGTDNYKGVLSIAMFIGK